MKSVAWRFLEDEKGATAVEYGLIVAVIGVGILVGLGVIRDGLNNVFNTVGTHLK